MTVSCAKGQERPRKAFSEAKILGCRLLIKSSRPGKGSGVIDVIIADP